MPEGSQQARLSRARKHLRVLLSAGLLLLTLAIPSASADPIKPSHQGCVSELPGNVATWTSSQHFQFFAAWDPVSGCAPTIAHPLVLHEWFENYDGTGGLKVETLFDLFPKCGRIQFDAQPYINATSSVLDEWGLVSLVFDTQVDCVAEEAAITEDTVGHAPGGGTGREFTNQPPAFFLNWPIPDLTPDTLNPDGTVQWFDDADPRGTGADPGGSTVTHSPDDPPSDPSTDGEFASVPEPAAALLVVGGSALLVSRIRRLRRARRE